MKFTAFERNLQGTGASRRLRNSGKTPGIVYGAGKEPKNIELDHNALYHAMRKEAFHSSILEMDLGGTVEKVLLRDYQKHPYKQLVLHVDFQRVDATTKIHKKVPLHFINEASSVGVKQQGGEVSHTISEVEVSCLPKDLPEFIEVDMAKVELGQIVHLSDLKAPKGVELVQLAHGNDLAVANIHASRVVKEEGSEEGAAE